MNITLCDKELEGDIPNYDFTDQVETERFLSKWLDDKDFDKSVFVCFANIVDCSSFRDEYFSFLITHNGGDIVNHYVSFFEDWFEIDNIQYNIFEFENYQEAFKYCADLMESF